jgi:virginiamycin B lyase
MSGYADRISMAPDGAPYVVSSGGGVYSYRNSTWTPINNSHQPVSSAVAGADDGVYLLATTPNSGGNFAVWRKQWAATGVNQLPFSGVQLAASFDSSTYTIPGVGTIAPYGFFVLQSTGTITYYNQDGTQAVHFPGPASSIAPVLGGFYALTYPQSAMGGNVYYFDYATGTATAESGTYKSLSAFAGAATSQSLFALDAQNRVWSTPISPVQQPIELTEYPVSLARAPIESLALTPGPGNAMWYIYVTDNLATQPQEIGRVTAAGLINAFQIPSPDYRFVAAGGITEGQDGALWFTGNGSIGRVTSAGSFTFYPCPNFNTFEPNTDGEGTIATGSDGAFWGSFYGGQYSLYRVTTAGVFKLYSLSQVFNSDHPDVPGIAAGSDGALWFTAYDDLANPESAVVGRISTSGQITTYPLVYGIDSQDAYPQDITAGPDGALWFIMRGPGLIGRITVSGAISTFAPPAGYEPLFGGITMGPDKALWFSAGNGGIGRLTTSGVFTRYQLPTENLYPIHLVAGQDGSIYYTAQYYGSKIGRIVLH